MMKGLGLRRCDDIELIVPSEILLRYLSRTILLVSIGSIGLLMIRVFQLIYYHTIMSISSFYTAKTIAILGTEVMTGMLLLERLLHYTHCSHIFLFLKTSNNSFESQSRSPQASKLFSLLGLTKETLAGRVSVVRFIENETTLVFERSLPLIDVIFNCYMPVELEAKSIYRHILFPRKLVAYLKMEQKSASLIALSTVYSQESGYVPEDDHIQSLSLPSANNEKAMEAHLRELNFTSKDTWQYTAKALEDIYFNSGLSVQLIRVPTVGATIKNCEGYIDKFNSFTWLVYRIGLGQIRELKGNPENTLDIMPADYVANYMIVIAAQGKGKSVSNLSTSTRNSLKLGYFIEILNEYWLNHPLDPNTSSQVRLYEKTLPYTLARLRNRLPSTLISKFANALDLKALKINTSKKLQQLEHRQKIANKFQNFLRQEWLCQSNKSIDLFHQLSSEQRQIFNFNPNDLQWKHYIRLNVYSLQSHLLGVEVEPYSADTIYVINKSKVYFDDIYWAYTHGKDQNIKSVSDTKREVLNSHNVKRVMKRMIEERAGKLEKSTANYAQIEKEVEGIAEAICDKTFSQFNVSTLRVFAWVMHKIFKQIYEQVVVDRNAIRELKNYEEKHQVPLILIPTHRSYIDFLVFPYLFFSEGIKTPFIGAADDFLNMAIVANLFRKSGAFFITRNQKDNRELYLTILNEYTMHILASNNHLKFFIEGTRSRLGKMMEPKLGLLNVACESVITGKIKDALIVPVTINYEKILEGASFPYELLGEPKVKESLGRLIKAVDVLKENYGQIHIEICKPISIKEYFSRYPETPHKSIVSQLGSDIVYNLSDNLVVTPCALVATIILMQRRGISQDEVKKFVDVLAHDIHSKGIKIARTQHNGSVSIGNALQLLGDIVVKSKKNIYELKLSADSEGINILGLCYYRNTLTHVYFLEAIVLVALSSFGEEQSRDRGVNMGELKARTTFLYSLIGKEYVLRDNLKDGNTFFRITDSLAKRGMVLVEDLIIRANSSSELLPILLSLVWPLTESYYLTLLYLFKLVKLSTSIQYSTLLTQVQWFGERMIDEKLIEHYEAISQDTVKNALQAYARMGVIRLIKEEVKGQGTVQNVKLEATEEVLKQLEENISKYLKGSYARSVRGKMGEGKRPSVTLDFPFLAKL